MLILNNTLYLRFAVGFVHLLDLLSCDWDVRMKTLDLLNGYQNDLSMGQPFYLTKSLLILCVYFKLAYVYVKYVET